MAAITDLINFFPSEYRNEITLILTEISNARIASTIEALSLVNPETLSNEIENNLSHDFLNDMHTTTIDRSNPVSAVSKTFNDYIIGDINDPQNPKELKRVENVWNYFLNLFGGDRQEVMTVISTDFQAGIKFTETSNPFYIFSYLSKADFKSELTSDFFLQYAEYLVNTASSFLRVNRRSYLAIGRIIESGTGKPVKKAKITAEATSNISIYGITYSNYDGYYNLYFSSLEEVRSTLSLNISVSKNGYNTFSGTIDFEPTNPQKILETSISKNTQSGSASISTIATTLGIQIPPFLSTFFSNKAITNLAGIRNIGLLRNRKELNGEHSDATLKKFDSLALFELVESDFEVNNIVIDQGYTSFANVASTPRESFVEDMNSNLGSDFQAYSYFEVCKNQTMIAIKDLSAVKDGLTPPAPYDPDLNTIDECGCGECNSAVGPMAYLADLLSFTFENLTDNGAPLNGSWLETNLYRNFTDIPIDCDELKDTICQARIATEALHNLYITIETTLPQDVKDRYNARKKEYLVNSYEELLSQLGTSYNELQSYQTVVEIEERRRYAHRLGITLDDPATTTDTIQNLYKDIRVSGALTELFLEEMFGLQQINTTAEPPESRVEEWKELRLRELWAERDHVNTSYSRGESVIIDPDIVTVDDFRLPKDSLSPPFNIWLNRRSFLDGQAYYIFLNQSVLQQSALLEGGESFTYNSDTKTNLWSPPLPPDPPIVLEHIELLVKQIKSGNPEAKTKLWDDYKLKADEAARLIEIHKKEVSSEDVTAEEKVETANICTNVVKRAFKTEWLAEETTLEVQLSSEFFWISEREPKQGFWPPFQNNAEDPYIDPQLLTLAALPEPTFQIAHANGGTTATSLYISFQVDLDDAIKDLDAASSIQAKVNYAYEATAYTYGTQPDPNTFLLLNEQLDSPVESDAAKEIIQNTLRLNIENFLFIMDMGVKYGDSPANLTEPERERLNSILLSSRKLFSLYESWNTAEGSLEYWVLRKASLPIWRATVEERKDWENALKKQNEAPIIDADLIGPAYIRIPEPTNAAFFLWQERYNEMYNAGGWYSDISSEDFSTASQFNARIERWIFQNSGINLQDVLAREEAGEDISKVIEQLNITSTDFRFFVDVYKSLAQSYVLTEDQLERLYYRLALVQKKRQFGKYRIQERDDQITQSPDFFLARDTDYFTYPPSVPYPLNEYLVTERQLSNWRKTVSSRVDEVKSVNQEYKKLLLDTDDETLAFLRDALVDACQSGNKSVSEKARTLGDRLLIDLQDNCCSKTNRVAQALESLQQLIWKTNTKDILSDYPNMVLHVDSFDTIWQWMGSYANWRASMFVFLYPENILLPSLKRESTPGFKEILKNTQNNRNFNPGLACEVVQDYQEYLKDVSSLTLKYSAQTNVVTQKEDKCSGLSNVIEALTFVFATAENSGKSYYMTVKSTEDEAQQKTYWNAIPGIPEKAKLKGADVYQNDKRGVHFVYLFYLVETFETRNTFFMMRYDVNKNQWDNEPKEFEVSVDALVRCKMSDSSEVFNTYLDSNYTDNELTIVELTVCQNTFFWSTPYLVLTLKGVSFFMENSTPGDDIEGNYEFSIFNRQLDWDGTTFSTENVWNKWVEYESESSQSQPGNLSFNVILHPVAHAAFKQNTVDVGKPDWYGSEYYLLDNEGRSYIIRRAQYNGAIIFDIKSASFNSDSLFSIGQFLNPFRLKLEEAEQPDATDQGYQYAYGYNANNFSPFFLNGNMLFSLPNRGYMNEGMPIPFIYQDYAWGGAIRMTTISFDEPTSNLSFGESSLRLNPSINQIPSYDPDLIFQELSDLKENSQINLSENNFEENPKLRNYIDEAFYFAPMEIAMKLSDNGYYKEALEYYRMVYDYYAPPENRKIYYGLTLEENYENLQDRMSEWYTDPLNPHAIAGTRQNAYTRFTMMMIANTFLAYANAEYTTDNSESVPRAREMYEDIIDLLSILETSDPCDREEVIASLDSFINDDLTWRYAWERQFRRLYELPVTQVEFDSLKTTIEGILGSGVDTPTQFEQVRNAIDSAADVVPMTLEQRLVDAQSAIESRIGLTLVNGNTEPLFRRSREVSRNNSVAVINSVTGFTSSELDTANLAWLYTDQEAEQSETFRTNPVANTRTRSLREFARKKPRSAVVIDNPFEEIRLSGMPYLFCVNPNPMIKGTLMMAHSNLYKIHNCMNIAGMVRELNPFAAPTDAFTGMPSIGVGGTLQTPGQASIAPTQYRYAYLVERAKQLVSFAQQMESSMLQSLERFDAESYSLLKARQDLDMAKANIKLQDLKVKEAESNKVLAELQRDRAKIQVDGLQEMIDQGLLGIELSLVITYTVLGNMQAALALAAAAERTIKYSLEASTAGLGAPVAGTLAVTAGASSWVTAAAEAGVALMQSYTSIGSLYASFERRKQEWNYQKSIAQQDVKIGGQQVKIANDRIRISNQERAIAGIMQDHAEATLEFLKTKFTNAELYEWMSGILEDVYSFFLQEATAMSKLAEQQLAFERQINLPSLIKSDYWNFNTNSTLSIGASTSELDRKGLTGSARLLRDLTDLELYAMDTNERKLHMTKIISLNEHDPVQMEMFRDSGILQFTLTQQDFDWDYPGHYLRIIRRVNVSIIALTPPNKGIKATLIHNGLSHVVVSANNFFQNRVIARSPERIALSSPYNEYGVFQLDTQDNIYRPFEGNGVEGMWELRMEKASNPFDYRSIADVLITIEYDALHSELYSQIIKNRLNQDNRRQSLVYSLRNDLPDQWYELQNMSDGGLVTSFEIRNSDLAPNVGETTLKTLKVYMSFDFEKMERDEVPSGAAIDGTFIISKDGDGNFNGEEVTLNTFLEKGIGTYGSFPNIEEEILGTWHLGFSSTAQILEMIENEYLRDIVIIIQYDADMPLFNINQ